MISTELVVDGDFVPAALQEEFALAKNAAGRISNSVEVCDHRVTMLSDERVRRFLEVGLFRRPYRLAS